MTQSPNYRPENLDAVAYLGFALGSTVGEEGQLIMEPLMQRHLLDTSTDFVILPIGEVERRAVIVGAAETLAEIRDYWRDEKRVDKFKLAELGEALGVGAVLVGVIDEWSQSTASSGTGDASFTRISATLSLYSVSTGRSLWRARASETLESESLEQDMDGSYEQQTAQQRERQRSAGVQVLDRAPGPPRGEVVAEIVAAALARALAS